MADAVSTWAGTHTFGAARVVAASSAEEAADAVRTFPGPVRALGTRHSFHDIADTDGTLISLTDAPADPELVGPTVTVGGGTRYGVLAAWLEERGWALANMG